ncbi:MAG: hypothetical protein P4M09_19335 [Devosia sp.]|nr:hypothetical protein [Devosia sp.]
MTDSALTRRDSLRGIAALGIAGAAVAVGAAAMATPAEAAQPFMRNALNDLQAARNALDHALADKAGHRLKAIALIDQAIGEVKAGMMAGMM